MRAPWLRKLSPAETQTGSTSCCPWGIRSSTVTESCRRSSIGTDGKLRLWPATLYGTLKRLIDEELIEESDERPALELDDARRAITGSQASAGVCWPRRAKG